MRQTSNGLLGLLASCLMTLSSICIGQELPNATDLQSAYCITIVNQEIAALSSGDATDQTTEQIRIVNEVLEKAKYGLHRLQAYLLPRLQYLETVSILVAQQRATEDMNRGREVTKQCASQCNDFDCLKSCTDNNEYDDKFKKCRELNFLPY